MNTATAVPLRALTAMEKRAVQMAARGVPHDVITAQTRLSSDLIAVAVRRQQQWDALADRAPGTTTPSPKPPPCPPAPTGPTPQERAVDLYAGGMGVNQICVATGLTRARVLAVLGLPADEPRHLLPAGEVPPVLQGIDGSIADRRPARIVPPKTPVLPPRPGAATGRNPSPASRRAAIGTAGRRTAARHLTEGTPMGSRQRLATPTARREPARRHHPRLPPSPRRSATVTRRDYALIALNAAGLMVALSILSAVLDTTTHPWVTAVWALCLGTLALTAVLLAGATAAAGWVLVSHYLRRILRRTIPSSRMARSRSGNLARRRTRPTVAVAADPFDAYVDQFHGDAHHASDRPSADRDHLLVGAGHHLGQAGQR